MLSNTRTALSVTAASLSTALAPVIAQAHVTGSPHMHQQVADSLQGGVAPWLLLVGAIAALLGVLSLACFIRRRGTHRSYYWGPEQER